MLLIVLGHRLAQMHKTSRTMQSLRYNLICYYLLWGNGWLRIPLTFTAPEGSSLRQPGPSIMLQNPAHFWVFESFHQINGCSTDYKIFLLGAKWCNFKNSFMACWNMFRLQKLFYYNIPGHWMWMFFDYYTSSFIRLQCSWPLYMVGH